MAGIEVNQSVTALQASLRGEVIGREHPGYDEARSLYNAMIDKRPRFIARCVDAADVMAAVRFARESELEIAVRGGGHNGAGSGSVDDGLVVDLSALRGVIVDPDARTARVLGGSLLGDVDHATHPFGLALPFGFISTTGIGGLTLGGGVGNLTRTLGLTIDSLLAADVVLADGSFVQASDDRNDDLFWALRGGGGNFGVVTSFTFRLSPMANVVAGPTFWPLERGGEILRWYREFISAAPEQLNGWFAFLTVPPVPLFPEELHLTKVCAVLWTYAGSLEGADQALAPVRALEPILDGVREVPLPALNSVFDALYPSGHQWYWRTAYVREIPDEAVDAHLEHARELPTPQSTMHLYPVSGAPTRYANDDTAWAYRDASWVQVMVGVDPDPAKADELRRWAAAYAEALDPFSMGGGYVNMMMDEGQERVRATYRGNYDRLAAIKAKYDPDNLFHVNQNIRPA
ncbi:MAG TPA: FAD-binding oxidoreductase [Gaiellaceae bacterium]|nr:FAD-binding oxidoreductase [Gaiellaceae bacterium]